MKPTYAELELALHHTQTELSQSRELLKKAIEEIGKLQDEIAKLKEQLNRNSKNSSKPPSSDQKANTDSGESKKKRKGRKGKAKPLYPSERVNHHVDCGLDNCQHCGSINIHWTGDSEILHQAELPEAKAIITEYELLKYRCYSCGGNSVASLPPGIPDSAFGPKLMGLLATLTGVLHLAKREAAFLIKELYGVDISIGSVPNIEERVSQALDPIYQRIHCFVIESKFCKHFDETSWRDRGKRHYVWLASCEHASCYMIDRHRSAEAFGRLFTADPNNISAVTDRYAVYSIFKVHQYCLAHLIREFRSYAERDGPDQEFGKALENELRTACHIHKRYREGNITLEQRNRRLGHCKRRLGFHLDDGFANGSDDLSKLCDSLLENYDKLWTFTRTLGMEPTNNLAERDLRKLVIWRRKSYGTRSERGKSFVERITTVAQTLKKQSRSILAFIQEAVASFYSKEPTPFISEAMGF
jgi:transposase